MHLCGRLQYLARTILSLRKIFEKLWLVGRAVFCLGKAILCRQLFQFSLSAPILLTFSILSSILLKLRPILRQALCGHAWSLPIIIIWHSVRWFSGALNEHYLKFWALNRALNAEKARDAQSTKSKFYEHCKLSALLGWSLYSPVGKVWSRFCIRTRRIVSVSILNFSSGFTWVFPLESSPGQLFWDQPTGIFFFLYFNLRPRCVFEYVSGKLEQSCYFFYRFFSSKKIIYWKPPRSGNM